MCKHEWTTQHYLSVSQTVLTLSLRMEAKCSTTAHAANIAAQWHGGYAYLSVILELSVSTDPECTYLTIKLALSSVSCYM